MLEYYLGYLLLGTIWTLWLEWFCTNNLEGQLGRPFTNPERLFQILIWPGSLAIFIYNFLKDVFNKL